MLTFTAACALVGVGPVVTAVAALGLVPATAAGPWSGAVAMLAACLLVLLCVVASARSRRR